MSDQEERLVAELESLGVGYLSRESALPVRQVRAPQRLLAGLIRQPSSRVRTAVIAVLLAHPELARNVPGALRRLHPAEQLTLKLFYTAAVALQKEHARRLQAFMPGRWQSLPDDYSAEFHLDASQPPGEFLRALGSIHRQQTGSVLNWTGTYENVAHHLLRRWELERQWSQ
jgi:hypothetical protein